MWGTEGRIIALEETICKCPKFKKVLACSKKRESPGVSIAIKRDMISILHEVEEQGRTTSDQQGVRTHDKLWHI